jgi:hypothetical protein
MGEAVGASPRGFGLAHFSVSKIRGAAVVAEGRPDGAGDTSDGP